MARVFGSLQLAVTLLPIFAGVLFLGTVIESWHGRPVAASLVYQTWWFLVILALLGANIFCAAAKKWPWKRHQIGFLITHVGLLTLIAGGVVDSLTGTTGELFLVNSDDPRAASYAPRRIESIVDRGDLQVRLRRSGRGRLGDYTLQFAPGPAGWDHAGTSSERLDRLTAFLETLAHPLPRSTSIDLDDQTRLEVVAYVRRSIAEPFGPAPAASPPVPESVAFPAIRFQLASALTGILAPQWVALDAGSETARIGPGLVSVIGRECSQESLAEFHSPPATVGRQGQLVVGIGPQSIRFDVARDRDQPGRPLGATGWEIQLERHQYGPVGPNRDLVDAVQFSLRRPGTAGVTCVTTSAMPGAVAVNGPLPAGLWVWYHVDPLPANDSARAILQFAAGRDGLLYYRSFGGGTHGDHRFEGSGQASGWHPIWSAMGWRFRVRDFLPKAFPMMTCQPADQSPDLSDDPNPPPAVRCKLSRGPAWMEFWLRRTDEQLTPVTVGGERFEVGLTATRHDLGFGIELIRAESATMPGAGPACDVRLIVEGKYLDPQRISLNQPLNHGGYKIYQGAVAPLGRDDAGRPMFRVQLLANSDPGMWFKYAGSAMLALGIACMFYMRAYFFKRR
jgi:hypothetical protein